MNKDITRDIKEIKANFLSLLNSNAVAGNEFSAAKIAADILKDSCDDIQIDNMNNVFATLSGSTNQGKTILLDAHIDRIGLIVTAITEDGFVKAERVGGVDCRGLIGKDVTIHCKSKDILGVICSTPPHLAKTDDNKIPPINKMSIDVGFSKKQAEQIISAGDNITINSVFASIPDKDSSIISSAALDDLAGCICLIYVAKKLSETSLNAKVILNLSVQEETSGNGSKVCAYKTIPDEAIAVDVSFAKTPDSPPYKCGIMSKGTMIGISPTLNSEMSKRLISLAKLDSIPYQSEVMGGRTGTNCDSIATSRNGIKTALLSIPQKYMHSSVEIVDINDILSTANLIIKYILN